MLDHVPTAASRAPVCKEMSTVLQLYSVTYYIWVAFKPASLPSLNSTDLPPLAPPEFQRMRAPPEEELLVDCCFDEGDGEVVGHEKEDEPVRVEAVEVWGR